MLSIPVKTMRMPCFVQLQFELLGTKMKKILIAIAFLLLGQVCFPQSSGLLFNVSISGGTLTFTPKANHSYPDIGMLITSSGYSFSTPNTQCSGWPNTNGYCKFAASFASPAFISINGPIGVLNFKLCLNLTGKLTCQNYSVNTVCTAIVPVVSTAFSGTNIELGRLFRNGTSSTCLGKAFPGTFGPSTQYYYETFTFRNPTDNTQCVTVNFDPSSGSGPPCGFNTLASAYLNAYDPSNIQTNYVGDAGGSASYNLSFSFNVPGNTDYVIVATTANFLSTCGFSFSITPSTLACSRS